MNDKTHVSTVFFGVLVSEVTCVGLFGVLMH